MTPEERAANKGLSGLRRHGGLALAVAAGAPVLAGVLLVFQAWLLSVVLGQAIEEGVAARLLLPSILAIAAILAVRIGLSAIGEQAGAAAAEAIKRHLRDALLSKLMSTPPRQAAAPPSGAAATAIVEQVEGLDGFFARYLPAAMQAGLLPLIFGAIILPLDWVAGLLFLVTAPLIPVFMALVGWGAQLATDRQAQALSRLTGRFADRLRGLMTLKLMGRAAAETQDIVAASEALRVRSLRVLRIAFLSSAVLEFFAALGVAGVALYIGLTFIDFLHLRTGPLTLQLGVFLLLMAPEVYNPLRLLAAHYHDRATARAALVEIERQLGALPDQVAPLSDIPSRSSPAISISLENFTLRTPDRLNVVLDNTALEIAAGQHVAILGPSGSGKSSLLEAVAGIRNFEGSLNLDGLPLSRWEETERRARIFLLAQKPRLIHASLAENIALGAQSASRADIERAADRAFVSPFAAALPLGLDTVIGEDGNGLSGGQAQRVALARLYLRDPALILLDEPTAHLDAELEAEIMAAITSFARGRTLVVATHSSDVASQMHKVWRIAGEGLLPTPIPQTRRGVA